MISPEQAERLERAIDTAKQALTNDSSSPRGWHDLGMLYQTRGSLPESRIAFERAIQLDPRFASAHNNLGNTFVRLGNNAQAVESYRRAIELEPSLLPAHANAAAALHVLGRNDEALVHARRAVEINPHSTAACITAAFIEGALRGYDVALASVSKLVAAAPTDVSAISAQAHLLLRLERFQEAYDAAERGLALAPNNGLLLESLGCALRGLGRSDEALLAFDRAYELGHDRANVLVLKASGLLEVGRMAEAQTVLEAALALVPDLAAAWSALVELRPFASDDPDLAVMETMLEHSPALRGLEPRIVMHFALGKAYRKAGNHDSAFRHFAAGNTLKRRTINYDAARDERFARATIERFTPELMERHAGKGDTSRDPIFVIGMPRSGTSLVEQILASHPGVYGAGELTLFDRAIDEAGDADPAALGARYLELVDAIAPGGKRVVDKLPSNFRHVAMIRLALPRARIIHCVRDALDTSFSCYVTLFTGRQDFSWDLAECGRYYRIYQALMEHWRTLLPPGVMLDVNYEDVVADLEGNARRILAFCDLPWDPAVLAFHETARIIRTASFNQARQPIYRTSVRAADVYRPYIQPLIDALAAPTPPAPRMSPRA